MLAMPEVQERMKYNVYQKMPKEGFKDVWSTLEVSSGSCQGSGILSVGGLCSMGGKRILTGSFRAGVWCKAMQENYFLQYFSLSLRVYTALFLSSKSRIL